MNDYFYLLFLEWSTAFLHITALLLVVATAYLYTTIAARQRMRITPLSLLFTLFACCTTLWRPLYTLGSTLVAGCFFRRWQLFLWHTALCCIQILLLVWVQQKKHHALETFFSRQKHTVHAVVQEYEPWYRGAQGARVTLHITHVDYQPLTATIRCFLYRTPRFSVGQTICVYRLQTTAPKERSRGLNASLIRDGIAGVVFAPFISHRICRPWSMKTTTLSWRVTQRSMMYRALQKVLPEDVFVFLGALFFGNKNHASYATVRRSFAAWGLSHYLARSGLHIALIIMFLSFFFSLIACPYWLSFLCISVFLWGYWLLSWSSISFVRALVLWLLYASGIALHRRPNSLYLLSLVTLGTLLYEPYNGFCIDFQLSFFLTGVLVLHAYTRHNQLWPLLAWRRAN